jgi:hypothetical protein
MPDLVCIQETKLAGISNTTIRNALGGEYENNLCYLPAEGTQGGILLAARNNLIQLQNVHKTNHTISATAVDLRSNLNWTFTRVYGPKGI